MGRQTKGHRAGQKPMSVETVRAIVARLETTSDTHAAIASTYGLHPTTVSDIARGKTWRRITGGRVVRAHGNHKPGPARTMPRAVAVKVIAMLDAGKPAAVIADALDVSRSHVYNIRSGDRWGELSGYARAAKAAPRRRFGAFEKVTGRRAWLANLRRAIARVGRSLEPDGKADKVAVRKLLKSIEQSMNTGPAAYAMPCSEEYWLKMRKTGEATERARARLVELGRQVAVTEDWRHRGIGCTVEEEASSRARELDRVALCQASGL